MSAIKFNTSDYPPLGVCTAHSQYTHSIESNPDAAFLQAMTEFGLEVAGTIETGNIVRVSHCDKPSKKTGWYVYFGLDPISGIAGGIYGDWRHSDDYHYWSSKTQTEVTPEQWKQYQQRVDETKKKAEMEKKQRQNKAAKRCQNDLLVLPNLTWHPYLDHKQVAAYGLYEAENGALIVPMCNSDGELRNYQSIYDDGKKYFQEGAQVLGCFHLIGTFTDTLYVCEGYATGATIHDVTACGVIVAFNTSNLKPVTCVIKDTYPDKQLIIAADNDRHTTK